MKELIKNTLQLVNQPDSRELLKSYLEIGLDTLVENETVKSIPIVNTLSAGGKFLISVRDQLFLNKMRIFMDCLDKVSDQEINDFIKEIEKKHKKDELGEQVIIIVEQADSKIKARLLGILFKMYIERLIDKDIFDMLTNCTNKAYMEDLYSLTNNLVIDQTTIDPEIGPTYISLGLAWMGIKNKPDVYPTPKDPWDGPSLEFELNEYGKHMRIAVSKLEEFEII